jgi:hypothetical protein
MSNIKVMHFGLGPIGAAIVRQVAARPGFKIVGAIDIDPAKVGRDLGDLVLLPRLGAKVSGDAAKALKSAKPDVVVLCTSSSIEGAAADRMILQSKTPLSRRPRSLVSRLHAHLCQIHARRRRRRPVRRSVNPALRGRTADPLTAILRARGSIDQPRAGRGPPSFRFGRRSAPASPPNGSKKVDDGSVHVGRPSRSR